jgi:SAM-dependent methyltransferase
MRIPSLRQSLIRLRHRGRWVAEDGSSLKRRTYASYEAYLAHQRAKLEHKDLSEYDVKYRGALRERIEQLGTLKPGMSALCLAARIGTEVRSFIDLGLFAVGIDLNPGPDNLYVVHGDFHQLQYADASIDVVFSNSLDHAYEIERLIAEVRRVLKPGGQLVLEVVRGSDEGKEPGDYESFWWAKVDDVVELWRSAGFELASRTRLRYPWRGEQLHFYGGTRRDQPGAGNGAQQASGRVRQDETAAIPAGSVEVTP